MLNHQVDINELKNFKIENEIVSAKNGKESKHINMAVAPYSGEITFVVVKDFFEVYSGRNLKEAIDKYNQ